MKKEEGLEPIQKKKG